MTHHANHTKSIKQTNCIIDDCSAPRPVHCYAPTPGAVVPRVVISQHTLLGLHTLLGGSRILPSKMQRCGYMSTHHIHAASLPACLRFTHMCTALCSHVHGRVALPRLHIHTACLAVCLPACASRTHMYEVRCSHVHGQVSLPRLLLLVLVRAWQHLLDARGQAGLGLVAGA